VGSDRERNGAVARSSKLGIESRTDARDARPLYTIELDEEVTDFACLATSEELDAGFVVIRLPDSTLGRGENDQGCT
jgi:hypothetical protein